MLEHHKGGSTHRGANTRLPKGELEGCRFTLTKYQVRPAQAAMANRDASGAHLCNELGINPVTLYRYVGPAGELREHGKRVLGV